MTQLKVGQIWEYVEGLKRWSSPTISSKKEIFQLTSPLTVVEIMAIFKPGTDGVAYHPCHNLRDDSNIFDLAILDSDGYLIMQPKHFAEAITDGDWVLMMDVVEAPKVGATCATCKQDYPYANYDPSFECWACVNGF